MENRILKAKTKYCDLIGTIAIDFPGDPGRTEFENYIAQIGIDLNKYDPQGFQISKVEGANVEDIAITIIVIDKEKSDNYARIYGGRLPVVKIHNADKFMNFMKFLHRLEIICFKGLNGDSNDPENFDIVEDIIIESEN